MTFQKRSYKMTGTNDIQWALNDGLKALADQGPKQGQGSHRTSQTQYGVRNYRGDLINTTTDHITALSWATGGMGDRTVDSRQLTVTLEVGKWGSEIDPPKTAPEKPARKFKVGDRVKVVAPNNYHYGKLGTIVEPAKLWDWRVTIDDGDTTPYDERELEAVAPEPKFKVGDRVKINAPGITGHGKTGRVTQVATDPGDRYPVRAQADGDPFDTPYKESELVKVEPEPLASWEREVMGLAPEPKFKVGDTVKFGVETVKVVEWFTAHGGGWEYRLQTLKGQHYGYALESQLEAAQEYKVGDRLRLKKSARVAGNFLPVAQELGRSFAITDKRESGQFELIATVYGVTDTFYWYPDALEQMFDRV